MTYDIQLQLPGDWHKELETYLDESGAEISHLEAHLYNDGADRDDGMIDIYVGEMPEDISAEDQALSNYADIVGFDDDDPEDFNPIVKLRFNGRNAWGFDAYQENDFPMRLISQEVRSGALAIIVFSAPDRDALVELHLLIERTFRVKVR